MPCEQFSVNNPPLDARSGPYNTLEECQQNCVDSPPPQLFNLARCNSQTSLCNMVQLPLTNLSPLNTCQEITTGAACGSIDQYIVPMTTTGNADESYVIICQDDIDSGPYGFSQEFLNAPSNYTNLPPGHSGWNGTGVNDCVYLMRLYSPVEDGDYCDRVHLDLWLTVPYL